MTTGPVTRHLALVEDPTIERIAKAIHATCMRSHCNRWERHRHVAMQLVTEFTPEAFRTRAAQAFTQGVLAGRYAEQRQQGITT